MSQKNPVTPPEIDSGTFRLVAQRLKNYTTPGTKRKLVDFIFARNHMKDTNAIYG
jgi:hypothetical protein